MTLQEALLDALQQLPPERDPVTSFEPASERSPHLASRSADTPTQVSAAAAPEIVPDVMAQPSSSCLSSVSYPARLQQLNLEGNVLRIHASSLFLS